MRTILSIVIIILIILGIFYVLGRDDRQTVITPPNDEEVGLPVQEGLPEAVEEKRQAIYEATQKRDYEELASLAGENFSYSFGAPEGTFEDHLRRMETSASDEDAFTIISELLAQPAAQQQNLYVWPYFFVKEAKDWTEQDIEYMREVSTDEEIESYKEFGAYIGYRIGIMEDGTWTFFIAGD